MSRITMESEALAEDDTNLDQSSVSAGVVVEERHRLGDRQEGIMAPLAVADTIAAVDRRDVAEEAVLALSLSDVS